MGCGKFSGAARRPADPKDLPRPAKPLCERSTILAIPLEVFREGRDVYIEYPFEDAMFRYEHKTGKVFMKFYGEAESEIPHSSELFHDAIRSSGGGGGRLITVEQYAQGKPGAKSG